MYVVDGNPQTILEIQNSRKVDPYYHSGQFFINIDNYFSGVIINPEVVNPHAFALSIQNNSLTYNLNQSLRSTFLDTF